MKIGWDAVFSLSAFSPQKVFGVFNFTPHHIVVSLAKERPVKTRTNKYLPFWKKKKKVIRLLLFNARAGGYNLEEKKLAYVTVSSQQRSLFSVSEIILSVTVPLRIFQTF